MCHLPIFNLAEPDSVTYPNKITLLAVTYLTPNDYVSYNVLNTAS